MTSATAASVSMRRHHARAGGVELEVLVLETAGEARRAQDEQDVADDRAGERRLDDAVVALLERDQGDDELGGVAEGGVQEPADAFARALGQVLGRFAQPTGERHDREARADEDRDVRLRMSELEARTAGTKTNSQLREGRKGLLLTAGVARVMKGLRRECRGRPAGRRCRPRPRNRRSGRGSARGR